MKTRLMAFVVALSFIGVVAGEVRAADLRVMCAVAMRAVAEELFPNFEAASGHKVVPTFGTVGALVKQVQDGTTPDVIIAPRQGLDALVKSGKLAEGSVTPLALGKIGVAVKRGAVKPDVSTPEAFRRTMLLARAVTYVPPSMGGVTGPHLESVFERLGIAREMAAKSVYPKSAGAENIAEMLNSGQAELAVNQAQDIAGQPGLEYVGPLPGDLQSAIPFVAAVFKGGNDDAAIALVRFLRTPESAAIMQAKGMDPVNAP